jgi:hypothetical protein
MHADLVHLREPGLHVVLGPSQGQRRPRSHAAHPRIQPDDPICHTGEVGQVTIGKSLEQWERHRVRMHIDRRCPGRLLACGGRHRRRTL